MFYLNTLIYDSFYYLKYFIYFNIFLNSLFLNYCSYELFHEYYFINYLYFSINLNGCFLIKLSQWINTQLHAIDFQIINNSELLKIRKLFDNFFENCNIHDINYTKEIFKNDTGYKFNDIIKLDKSYNIKSGSMAQVYKGIFKKDINNDFQLNENINENINIAIKVVHPEIKYQIFFPEYLIYSYQYFVKNYKCFKKYDNIFDFTSFIENLKLQFNMNNEYKNMKYFYNYYNNIQKNEYILIPKPIMSTKNILIMEYVHGESFDEIQTSEYNKKKICGLFSLFVKDNYLFMDYFHNDIHNSNWKIIKYNDFYKLIIYDFGYILKNDFNKDIQLIMYYLDTNNKNECAKKFYNLISNIDLNLEEFIQLFNSNIDNTMPYDDDFIFQLYNFLFFYNFKIKNNNLLEFFILMMLIRKNMKIYFLQKKNDNNNIFKYHLETYLFYNSLIKKYNIFQNIGDYFENQYFKNPDFLKLIEYKNKYLQDIKSNKFNQINESEINESEINESIINESINI